MAFKKVEQRISFPKNEEKIINFWNKNKIFEKSVDSRPKTRAFSFYDGPPYATGTPHYGHLVAGTIKDVIPRYKTMQGYRVERIWGWDTHGLPIENIVEQELGFKTKLQVKEFGIDKFNEECRKKVLHYAKEWEKVVMRTGRWVDMNNAYVTMNLSYMESVWWVFSELWKKDLVYKGHKVMPYCPRCATGLSSFEVGLGGYKDKTDKAVTVKFEVEGEKDTYLLAWTTTPWTLPGNLALAVGKNIKYAAVKKDGSTYILAKERLELYEELKKGKIEKEITGKDLLGKKYKPVYEYYEKSQDEENRENAFTVIVGDFVSTEDGTGIVHIAPAFGEDDYRVAKENKVPFFMPVNDLGEFEIDVPEYAGKSVVHPETNEKIISDLGDKIFKVEDFTHQYPFCWRCETPLIYKAIDSYFVRVEKLKKKMLESNKHIYWMPKFVGAGRFAKMIETAPDWNISRNRFWGVPLPVWECEKCEKTQVFGSVVELEKKTGKKVTDIHLHKVKDLSVKCDCGGKAKITGEVLDVWFDSGSMPYGSIHYPFENKDKFRRDFPADFIAEGIDQTRGWFNSLMILGTALFEEAPYKNVVVNGTVLAEDGQKMSKHLRNYPDPAVVIDKYGADALRFYLMGSPAVKADDLRFSEKGVEEVVKKVTLTLWNSYSFFVTYALLDKFTPKGNLKSPNLLDQWVLSKTNVLVESVTNAMETYDLSAATRLLEESIDDLSNWYIRRSRKRFWKSENDKDKVFAYETLYFVLKTYIKLLAPFMPFVTEEIYQNLVVNEEKENKESVHLSLWPDFAPSVVDEKLEREMDAVREIVEAGLAQRNEHHLKVRQPLSEISVTAPSAKLASDLQNIILEEVNCKTLKLKKGSKLSVKLNTKITPELKAEGLARDLVRQIQDARKKANFNVEDRIRTYWDTKENDLKKAINDQSKYIAKETLSLVFEEKREKSQYDETVKLDGRDVWIGVTKAKGK